MLERARSSSRAAFSDYLNASPKPVSSFWERRFGELLAFCEQHGHFRVRADRSETRALALWVAQQHTRWSKLPPECLERLHQIEFPWTKRLALWVGQYLKLVDFWRQNGHCCVPESQNRSLGLWVQTQRANYHTRKLSTERQRNLQAIGFSWCNRSDSSEFWEKRLQQLQKYHQRYGHYQISRHWAEDPAFAQWVYRLRCRKRANRLSVEYRRRLDAMGFAWDDFCRTPWEKRFRELQAFQHQHGHCRVSPVRDRKLSEWVSAQRVARRHQLLPAERYRKLQSIGFSWTVFQSNWEKWFGELKKFRRRHGHCQVPLRWSANPTLGRWVGRQRKLQLKQRLSPERQQRLDALGFVWDPYDPDQRWEENFQKLQAFHKKNGHFRVSADRPDERKLERWVNAQREAYRQGRLSKARCNRLQSIGFIWDPIPCRWETQYAALQKFHRQHGHCLVAQRDPENYVLGRWVCLQRKRFRQKRLSIDRQQRLNALGFVWTFADLRPHQIPWQKPNQADDRHTPSRDDLEANPDGTFILKKPCRRNGWQQMKVLKTK